MCVRHRTSDFSSSQFDSEDPAFPGQTPVANVVDEAVDLLKFGAQHFRVVEIVVPVRLVRQDLEDYREHGLVPLG
jgi:hypothetical protein